MAPFPKLVNHTVDAIYRAYAASRDNSYEGLGISISNLGDECERALWYGHRWMAPPEPITGLKAIIFETGDIEEQRLLEALRMVGCEVVDTDARGKQFRYSAIGGHVRGKCDAKVLGVIEAPATWHMAECKSMQDKYFKPVVKNGVKVGYYSHWVQANTYAYLEGFERCLYICRNKNTGEVHVERWATDVEEAIRLLARAERIIYAEKPPAKAHEDAKAKTAFKCGYCRFKKICHENAFPRVHCRTCLHSTPEKHGDAEWSCARWAKPLGRDEQREGCGAHLYMHPIVPGDLIAVDEAAETITYRLRDGSEWVDGSGKARPDAGAEVENEGSASPAEGSGPVFRYWHHSHDARVSRTVIFEPYSEEGPFDEIDAAEFERLATLYQQFAPENQEA